MAEPEKRFQVGACSASVFSNEYDAGNGKVFMKTVVLQRSYKDERSGEWKASASFRVHEIPKAILALQKAYEYLVGIERS